MTAARACLLTAAFLAAGSPTRAVDLDIGRLEASVYSLPNVQADAKLGISEDAWVVSEFADPVLAFPWKQLDHSAGVNATCQVTVRLWEDASFPLGEIPEWKELVDKTVVLDDRGRRFGSESTFDREGRIRIPVKLSPATPVRRLKVQLLAKVDSPYFTDVRDEATPFYLTLRPAWKARQHHHPALMQMVALAYRRKLAAWKWKVWVRQAGLASRSLKDSKRFTPDDARRMLAETQALAARALDDDVLEQVSEDLLAESGKAMGELHDGIEPLSRELLGVRRLAFTYLEAAQMAWTRAAPGLSEWTTGRAFVAAFRSSSDALQVVESLDRVLYHLDRELEALTRLWHITNDGELALLLSRYEESLRLEDQEMVALGKALEDELGRDYAKHDWRPIQNSRLYAERFEGAAKERKPSAELLRAVWFGLYYLIRTEHFNLGVLAQAAREARKGFELNAPKVSLQPAFEEGNQPRHLEVVTSLTGATTRPGEPASYPITVRNLDRVAREVVVREVGPLPPGWFSSFSARELTLQPGETRRLTYAVTSPFYLQGDAEVRSAVRIAFDDEPARYHEPAFLTRALTSEGPKVALDPESRLQIEVEAAERTMRPGEVAKYTFMIRHHGPLKKLVTCELLSRPPEGWIAVLDPERLWLEPGEEARVDLRVTAPLYLETSDRQEWIVGIGYADEFAKKERIAFNTLATNLQAYKADPRVNGDVVRTYFVKPGSSATHEILIQNKGNVKDTFDVFVEAPRDGWYVRLEKPYLDLPEFSPPAALPLKVQAPAGAKAGDFVELSVVAVSATHPELRSTNKIRLAIVGDPCLELAAEGAPYRVGPGDELRFTVVARNKSEGTMKLGFRPAAGIARPGWLVAEAPVESLEAGATRRIECRIRPPDSERIGDEVGFALAAVNELGEEVAQVPFKVLVARRHEVALVLDDSRTLTAQGLVAVKLLVSNRGTVEDSVQLLLSGLKRRYWARLSAARLDLAPDETREITLFVRLPPDVDPGQDAVVEVQAKSAADSKARAYVSVTVRPHGFDKAAGFAPPAGP